MSRVNYINIILLFLLIGLGACQRQTLYERPAPEYSTALIPVKIDWSESGISPEGQSNLIDNQDYVHRVSFRIFPKNGVSPYEIYFEGQTKSDGLKNPSIYGGELKLPIGEYSIIATNESVLEEVNFWKDHYTFSDIDNYNNMTANTLVQHIDFSKPPYDFYKNYLKPNEKFHTEARKLATWTLDHINVTEEMVTRTRSRDYMTSKSKYDDTLRVKMQPLHQDIRLIIKAKNINSIHAIYGVITGISTSKTFVERLKGEEYSSMLFAFDKPNGAAGASNRDEPEIGETEYLLRSLGRWVNPNDDMQYKLHLDVVLINGTRYEGQNLILDITEELKKGDLEHIITITFPVLELPKVEGDPSVGDWNDNVIPL